MLQIILKLTVLSKILHRFRTFDIAGDTRLLLSVVNSKTRMNWTCYRHTYVGYTAQLYPNISSEAGLQKIRCHL